MRFILGIALIYGFVAQFATSKSHFHRFDTRKMIIFPGRALSGCAENVCNNAISRYDYWLYCCAKSVLLLYRYVCMCIIKHGRL